MQEYTPDMRINHDLCPNCGMWHTARSCPPQFTTLLLKLEEKDAELARLRDELDRKCIVTRNDDGTATSSCGREWKWVSPYYIGKEHTFYCTKCGGRLFIPPPSEGE